MLVFALRHLRQVRTRSAGIDPASLVPRVGPSLLNCDCGRADRQAFAEASAREHGTQRTRRPHTRNSPIVRAASRPRLRFANRSAGDRTLGSVARVQEPRGSASPLSIASGVVRDPCAAGRRRHSHRRLEQPTGRVIAEKSRAFTGHGVPLSSLEVCVRRNSHDRVVVASDHRLSLSFTRARHLNR